MCTRLERTIHVHSQDSGYSIVNVISVCEEDCLQFLYTNLKIYQQPSIQNASHFFYLIFILFPLQIGQYISSNGGVIAGEELAPYLDVSPNNETLVCLSFLLINV